MRWNYFYLPDTTELLVCFIFRNHIACMSTRIATLMTCNISSKEIIEMLCIKHRYENDRVGADKNNTIHINAQEMLCSFTLALYVSLFCFSFYSSRLWWRFWRGLYGRRRVHDRYLFLLVSIHEPQ